MTIDLMDYENCDTLLEAVVAFPSGSNPAPAVLVAHAWAGRSDSEHCIAERLASLGYVGIAIDVFGKGVIGDPAGDNTHLILPYLSARTALRDHMQAVVAFARQLQSVDRLAISAIGYCLGGLCVLDLARGDTGEVAGVVSLHGMLDDNGLPASGSICTKALVGTVRLTRIWLVRPLVVTDIAPSIKTSQ